MQIPNYGKLKKTEEIEEKEEDGQNVKCNFEQILVFQLAYRLVFTCYDIVLLRFETESKNWEYTNTTAYL